MSRRRPAAPPSLPKPLHRRVFALVTGLMLVPALAACSATNPILTMEDYDASDGVSVEVGDVRGLNLLVLSAAEGAPGVLIGALTNRGDETTTVTVTLSGGPDTPPVEVGDVRVAGGQTVTLDPVSGETLEIPAVPVAPGALVEVNLSIGTGAGVGRQVPVLDGTSFPEYAELVPGADET